MKGTILRFFSPRKVDLDNFLFSGGKLYETESQVHNPDVISQPITDVFTYNAAVKPQNHKTIYDKY